MFPLRSCGGGESATESGMNQILFVIGDWPVRVNDALTGFGVLVLVLLVVIAIVIARSGRRGAELAMAQAIRADELEQRLSEMLRAQSEATGRVDAMGQALAGRQAEMARAVNERLDSVTHRVGQSMRNDVLKHVSDIAEKYLIVGETQDTALMFVPSESVYAEIHDGFDDVIQKAYRARVVLVSPSLLMLAIQVMQQILKDARMRDAADQIRTEVLNLGDDLGRLRDRVLKLQKHFSDANEDIRQVLISADKIEKRAGRIEELDFSKETPTEPPRLVKSVPPELFPPARKLQAGE